MDGKNEVDARRLIRDRIIDDRRRRIDTSFVVATVIPASAVLVMSIVSLVLVITALPVVVISFAERR